MKREREFWEYCSNFVEKLMTNFEDADRVSGQAILHFSDIKAYNLLIIQNLMINWKIELSKLKSPYFNFDSPQVINELERFANVLSRNISINQEDFKELATESLAQVLTLINSPYQYFNQLILREDIKHLSLQDFEETIRYIKINRHVMEAFIHKLKEKNIERVFGTNDQLDEVFSSLTTPPENPDNYIGDFSKVLPLDHSLFSENNVQKETTIDKQVEEPVQEPKGELAEKIALHERFQENKETLADKHQRKPIADIRKSLSLNQRFMFINVLFEGNESEFNQIIDKVETMKNLDDVKTLFNSQFNWDKEMEEVQEFFEIVEKRFLK